MLGFRSTRLLGCALAGALLLQTAVAASRATAAEHLVRTVTESGDGRFHFEPSLLLIEVGDQVRFVVTSRLHSTKSIGGMMPADSPRWWGRMGQDMLVTFTRPGVYGYKCEAHYAVGMVGLIVVGAEPPNLEAAREFRHPPAAAAAFDELFARLDCLREAGGDCPD